MRPFSLAYLTAPDLAPPQAIRLANKLGYDFVGLRIAPSAPGGPYAPLIEDAGLLAQTCAACAESGVGVFDVEIVRIGSDFRLQDWAGFLDACAALEARAILVAGDDPDEARLTQNFAAFCAVAQPLGLTANLEFMPWTEVPDARTATRIVERSGAENARVLVDALHFARSATTLDDISAIPARLLAYAQLCDAPGERPNTTEGLIYAARCERLLPGEGAIDLQGLIARLPRGLPLSLEIPHHRRIAETGQEEWARLALTAARSLMARATASTR